MSEIIEYIDPKLLKPDPNQPRQTWTENSKEEIKKLAETYEKQGVIEPVEIDENNVIILGERRWKAALLKKLDKIPTICKSGLPPSERFERQLIDDAQRTDLSPMDRAWAYTTGIININTSKSYVLKDVKAMDKARLINLLIQETYTGKSYKKSGTAELARRIGKSQKHVWDIVSLLQLEPSTQKLIQEEVMPYTYGREIARVEEPEVRKELEKVVQKDFKEYPKTEDRERRTFKTREDVEDVVSFVKKPEIKSPVELGRTVEVELTKQEKTDIVTRMRPIEEIKRKKTWEIVEKAAKKKIEELPEKEKRKIEEMHKQAEDVRKKIKEIVSKQATKERGDWFRNWLAHGTVYDLLPSMFCPVCGKLKSGHLQWSCCGTDIKNALRIAVEKMKEVGK